MTSLLFSECEEKGKEVSCHVLELFQRLLGVPSSHALSACVAVSGSAFWI